MVDELRIYSPTSVLGYGFPLTSFERAMAADPHVIAVDGGSSDPGPNYLGGNHSFVDTAMIRRDLEVILTAAVPRGIPVLVGTSGGSGGRPHLALAHQIVEEIAREHGLSFRLALVHAEQDPDDVIAMHAAGRIDPLWPLGETDAATISRCTRIVGLMGVEPYVRALQAGAQVVLAGRSDDAAIFAGYAAYAGLPEAVGWLAGKLLECGSAATEPRFRFGHDGVLGRLTATGLVLEPLADGVHCTPHSVANMLLHENESPVHHREPNGTLDLTDLDIEALDGDRVQVRGAKFVPERPSIRLEGVEVAGYRTVTLAWTRDPVLIPQIDSYLDRARGRVQRFVEETGLARPDEYRLQFRLVGRDAVMGPREPKRESDPHELGIVIDTVADTAVISAAVAAQARLAVKNAHFEGKLCDEGCVTFPYSPSEIETGPVFRYALWHVVADPDMDAMFPVEIIEVGAGAPR